MSGGHFAYAQHRIEDIASDIEQVIINNDDLTLDQYGYQKGRQYSPEVIARLGDAVRVLRKAYIYAQRADWLFSGDDGEDQFLARLKAELLGLEVKS